VELSEFHIGHSAASAPGHGDAVSGGDVGVGSVQVDLAGAAGGQHHAAGMEDVDVAAVAIQHVSPQHPLRLLVQFFGGDQIDGQMMLEQFHGGALFHRCHHGLGHG